MCLMEKKGREHCCFFPHFFLSKENKKSGGWASKNGQKIQSDFYFYLFIFFNPSQ